MSASRWQGTPRIGNRRRSVRQQIIGLLMLPLSVLPFWAYFTFTADGRLLWEKVSVRVWKPHLPLLPASD
jgi:hypothetical protein